LFCPRKEARRGTAEQNIEKNKKEESAQTRRKPLKKASFDFPKGEKGTGQSVDDFWNLERESDASLEV